MAKKYELILNLSGLNEECFFKNLVNFLVGKNKTGIPIDEGCIELLIDDKKHISIFGKKVTGISRCTQELLDLRNVSKTWSDEDFENFLKQTINKTKQSKFKIYSYNYDEPKNVEPYKYMVKNLTDKIDWSETVNKLLVLNELKPNMIVIRSTDHEYRDDDRNIISIENDKYNVSVDSLGLNPDNNKITSCENHLLELYKKFSSKI